MKAMEAIAVASYGVRFRCFDRLAFVYVEVVHAFE